MLSTGAGRRLAMLAGFVVCVIVAAPASVQSQTDTKSDTLSPIARALLADALAAEDAAKRRGPRRAVRLVSFPFPMCVFEGGLCGAVNRDGSIAVAPKFDFVDEFHEGRAVVRLAGLYGYVDLQGKIVVEPQYALAGRYRLGLAEVDVDGKSALIDLDGKEVLAPRFAGAIPFTRTVFWVNDGERGRGRSDGEFGLSWRPGREELAGIPFRPTGNFLRPHAKWGMIDASGTWIREPEFRDIAGFDPENPELMWVMVGFKYGLIRPDGTWALEPVLQFKRELSDGLAAVYQDNRIGFIDRTGRMVIPPKFEGPRTHDFEDGMPAPAQLGGQVGLIDRTGNWVVEPTYSSILPYYYGGRSASDEDLQFKGFHAQRGPTSEILDHTGKVLIGGMKLWPTKSTSRAAPGGGIQTFLDPGHLPRFCEDGRIISFFEHKPQLFERDGTPLELREGELWWPVTCEPPYVVKVGPRYVHVDRWLRPLTAERFNAVGLFNHGLAAVVLRRKYGLIRDDGTWAIEPRFDLAHPIGRDREIVWLDRRIGVFDVANDRWVTQTNFDEVCGPSHFVRIVLDGKAGVIDGNGAWMIQPKYDHLSAGPATGLIPVRSGDKWGFVDLAGNEIIAPRFDEVSQFDRGISWSRLGGEWCPIDRRGNRVAGLSCQSRTPMNISKPRATFVCGIGPLTMPRAPQ